MDSMGHFLHLVQLQDLAVHNSLLDIGMQARIESLEQSLYTKVLNFTFV